MSGVQIIDVPGQGEVEFPSDMSDAQISAVIKRNLLAPMQKRMGVREMTPGSMRRDVDLPYEVGGRVTDVTGSPAAGALANAATDVATDPLTYLGGAVGKAAKPLLQAAGSKIMWSTLKPSKAARESGDAAKAVKTLLEEGANVSEGGAAKLTAKIDVLDAQLDKAIAESTAKLKNTDLLKSLQGVIEDYRAGTMGEKSIAKIKEVADTLLKHPFFNDAGEISVQNAQKMKRQNYVELGDKAFGAGVRPMAERDALQAVTRDLREGVANSASVGSDLAGVPSDAGRLNSLMSPLINARDLVQERSLAAANNYQVGLGWLLKNPTLILPWLLERNPTTASAIARTLHSGAAPAAPSLGTAAGGGMGLLLSQEQQQ